VKKSQSATKKRWVKAGGAILLSLLGLALMPLLALPYGGFDWLPYDPGYKGSYGYPAAPLPTAVPTPDIPCAEIPGMGEPLAAWVNGQSIGLEAFERELAQLLAALEASGADLESEETQAQMPGLRLEILELLIRDVLVQQAAIEFGIGVGDEEIQSRMTEEVELAGGQEPFQAWLDETGQTWVEFERDVCQEILNQRVLDHVTAEISGTMELVWARQIVVATEDEAVAVLNRLASGEPFDAVAREVSLDERTRDLGGDLGWFPRGFGWVPPEVEDAAFAGAPGQVQGPIRSGDLYYVVQTLEYDPEHVLGPETRDALRAIAFEQWLAERRAAAEVEIFIDLEASPE
jgi:parvulin-like peptidyl-prolyl isomerase